MAFSTGLLNNLDFRPAPAFTGPARIYPEQVMMVTAMVSLAALLQQLASGTAALGSGSPNFGGAGPGGDLSAAPCLESFLGGRNPWAGSGAVIRQNGMGASCPTGRPTLAPPQQSRGTEQAGNSSAPLRAPAADGNTSGPSGARAQTAPTESAGDRQDRLGSIDVERLVAVLPASRRDSARVHFPIIIDEARRQGVSSRAQLAYMLATANHESGAGRRMVEIASGEAYEYRRGLGNTEPGDGPRFRGRGYVQITGRRNYTDWSRRLGMDLVGQPSLAERPEIAARILVGGMREGTFTGRRLDRYVNDQRTDFDGARRVIGGGRNAEMVSQVAERLLAAMS
jgi:predicted chitinase